MLNYDGFIPGSRGSFVMDLVAFGLAFILPILLLSLSLVRYKKKYQLHKNIQIFLSILLLLVVILFELHIRIYGWRDRAILSPYYNDLVFPVLYFHLFCAISSCILWPRTIFLALKNFPSPLKTNAYSSQHKKLARYAVLSMVFTAISGWFFYYLAFIS